MDFRQLQEEEMYKLIGECPNPPNVQNQKEQNLFQSEILMQYERLVELLSQFGEEGDYYGISDFAVRQDLRRRLTVIPPPASHNRQFIITILTEKFYRSKYLEVLRQFLCDEASNYRVRIDQDFDSNLQVDIFLTSDLAQIYCTNATEMRRLQTIFTEV